MKIPVSLFSAALVICTASARRAEASLEVVGTNTIDIGQVYSYAKSTNTFVFANKGKTDIAVLDALSTCPCIQTVRKPQILKPGDTYSLETHFDARTVHGRFIRGVWLITDDPAQPRSLVKVTGEVRPLFEGVPEETIFLIATDQSATFTNELILTATTTNFFLKPPKPSIMQRNVSASLDKLGAGRYRLTTIIRPARYQQITSVKLPVEGPCQTDAVQIKFKIAPAAELRASPSKLIVTAPDKSFTRTFYINTQTRECNPDQLTWTPQLEGLEIKKEIYSSQSSQKPADPGTASTTPAKIANTRYTCKITISPEALKKIMRMKEHVITFSLPKHKSVKVEVISVHP